MSHRHQNRHYLPQITHTPPIHHPYNHHQSPSTLPLYHQSLPQPHYSDYENTLVNDVLYLHSLWHRGPPTPLPLPLPSSSTNPHYLKPSHTTHFKKKNKTPQQYCTSDKEWPVVETQQTPQAGPEGPEWPAFQTRSKPVSRPATAEERARVMGVQIQMKGVDACSCLFRPRNEDEDDDGEEEEEDEDYGDDEEEVDFFENLFEEDEELRGFYVKNCEGGGGGEFFCLVCGVIGKNNIGRKYKNCGALVQHSITVSKTKKKKAHRAYGNVICKVLGWDVNRLPSLPVPGGAEEKTSEVMKGEVKNHAVVEMERDAALAKPSQAETETILDALEKDNIASTDAGCSQSS